MFLGSADALWNLLAEVLKGEDMWYKAFSERSKAMFLVLVGSFWISSLQASKRGLQCKE